MPAPLWWPRRSRFFDLEVRRFGTAMESSNWFRRGALAPAGIEIGPTAGTEPRAIVAVLVFAMVFMVGFGIWHAPLLDFASRAVPDLSSMVNPASLGP